MTQWRKDQRYHFDYFFVPTAWRRKIGRVTVGGYETWMSDSDHMPIVVELSGVFT